MTRRFLVPTPDRPVLFHKIGNDTMMTALIENRPPSIGQMVALLAEGKDVLCRPGCRGQLTHELKRLGICTRQRTVDSSILFQKCAKREFK